MVKYVSFLHYVTFDCPFHHFTARTERSQRAMAFIYSCKILIRPHSDLQAFNDA